MRLSHEVVSPGDNAPTPEQLFSLASRGVVRAKEQGRLRGWRTREHVRFMMPSARFTIPAEEEVTRATCLEDRFAGRIARNDYNSWSMRLYLTHHISGADAAVDTTTVRRAYSFEWDRRRTTLAQQRMRIIPSPSYELEDLIDDFSIGDYAVTGLDVLTELEQVTAGDTELLIREVGAFASGYYVGSVAA